MAIRKERQWKEEKRFDKNPKMEMDDNPQKEMDFREKKKNSPAKTPFEKKKSGKMESKIN